MVAQPLYMVTLTTHPPQASGFSWSGGPEDRAPHSRTDGYDTRRSHTLTLFHPITTDHLILSCSTSGSELQWISTPPLCLQRWTSAQAATCSLWVSWDGVNEQAGIAALCIWTREKHNKKRAILLFFFFKEPNYRTSVNHHELDH